MSNERNAAKKHQPCLQLPIRRQNLFTRPEFATDLTTQLTLLI